MAANPSVGEVSLGIDSSAVMSTGPSAQRHEDPATPGGGVSDLDGISTGDLVDGALIAQRLTPVRPETTNAFEARACNRSFAGYDP
jgi:hypothetical protein